MRPSTPFAAAVCGWGGGPRAQVLRFVPRDADELRDLVCARSKRFPRGAVARGAGRSYGDAAQCAAGSVIDTSRMKGIALDADAGLATVGAGVTIGELLSAAIDSGWTVPVVPGTQHVTIGGAIASDIHGKNHGSAGAFGAHVRALELLTATGDVLALAPGADDGVFEATVGGMGLTGVILSAQIALRPVAGPFLAVDTDRASGLDEALALLDAPGGEHRVAWLDLLSSRSPRGVVTRARYARTETPPGRQRPPASQLVGTAAVMAVPTWWPGGILRPSIVRAHNELRYHRSPRSERGRLQPLGAHMFPLDVLDCWPRLYGSPGFVQYQFVVPRTEERTLALVIEQLRRGGIPCFLAVLKDLGPAGAGPLSFPIKGWTLALDLPRSASDLEKTLDACDQLVATAGGRVYLSKDSRMRAHTTAAMYPRLREWQATREAIDPDGLWRSDLAIRTGLVEARRA